MNLDELKNKTVLVLGAGKSGISSANFLVENAEKVILSESKEKTSTLEESTKELSKKGVELEFGKNSNNFIESADLIVTSPGIGPKTELIKKIVSLKKPLISEIELASYFTSKPIIGVTGTNGKTTTTNLIEFILANSNKKVLSCGNIGNPLIDNVSSDVDYFVVELSSYQIFYSPTLACQIAICLNITPDHLNWHLDFNHYVDSKRKLFSQQKSDSWSILNLEDKIVKDFPHAKCFYFSTTKDKVDNIENVAFFDGLNLIYRFGGKEEIIATKDDLKLFGNHNIENILASITATKLLEIDNEKIKDSLSKFKGVEHRLELVGKFKNSIVFNDSKATNPEATIKAIEAVSSEMKNKKITLILGGRDKNTNLDEIVKAIRENVNSIVLYGEAKDRFYNALNNGLEKSTSKVETFNEAVELSLSLNTDVVLFSPACASFDMFKNYEERGQEFKRIVSSIQ